MGPEYPATERVAGALAELSAALLEAEAEKSEEVSGFYLKLGDIKGEVVLQARPFVYDSKQPESFCSTVGNKQEPYLKMKSV